MFRFRRYRVFLIVAVFVILVVYHFTTVQEWEEAKDASIERIKGLGGAKHAPPSASQAAKIAKPEVTPEPKPAQDKGAVKAELSTSSTSSSSTSSTSTTSKPWSEMARPTTGPEPEEKYEKFKLGGKGRYEAFPDLEDKPVIHWERLPENFPVPEDMVIKLPTEKPRSIPKIQSTFQRGSAEAEEVRTKRAARVKEAVQHTWKGYRNQAWLNDELSPVSGTFRNPFNGWAATLVDGLDTLFIAGLEEEFKEAVEGVGHIDFTTSARKDIPLFETNIRYLGGLISAYDVSGQKHKILLDKAVELGDVLMSAFDTPNRMPITYYYWRPTFAKNPHRAGTRVVMSEIATLSLEFTRLAQITGNNRYYDAVARITDEFEQWQNDTKLPGLWPLTVDASGCRKPPPPEFGPLPGFDSQSPLQDEDSLPSVPKSAQEKEAEAVKNALEAANVGIDTRPDSEKFDKRSLNKRQFDSEGSNQNPPATHIPPEKVDCVPQGLTSPPLSDMESFSMGGQADSAFEYLPKMYLLLGGTVPKYREMYEKVIEAANKHLVFRPMVPGDLDLRVVGSVNAWVDQSGKVSTTLKPELSHLSCFTGGMWGIGGKIFQRNADLKDAEKLTNACYWAYQQSATGIMPDTAEVIPCADKEDCKWDKERWYAELDPWREYREAGERLHQEASKLAQSQEMQAAAALAAAAEDAKNNPSNVPVDHEDEKDSEPKSKPDSKPETASKPEMDSKSEKDLMSGQDSKSKQDASSEKGSNSEGNLKSEANSRSGQGSGTGADSKSEKDSYDQSRPAKRQVDDDDIPNTGSGSSFATDASPETNPYPTHEEFVESRIAREHIPEGIPTASNRKYILRPEAIESVFIMYRITGDESWREKGWKMFEAIDHWCRTEFGYSAIHDTTDPNAYQINEMESFWLAETLKYFYLLFSPPDKISLDEWVFNTEAHPFKRPK